MPPCLIGMEACVGAHHLSRKLQSLGHDARLMPAKYVRPYAKGQKNVPNAHLVCPQHACFTAGLRCPADGLTLDRILACGRTHLRVSR